MGTERETGRSRAVVIGAGFCGLAAAYELSLRGAHVTLLEQDQDIGGLAGSFRVGDVRLEKFYHHWFTNDRDIQQLTDELGASGEIQMRPGRTGMYFANRIYRLSTPRDVLRFEPLQFTDRLRLGLLALRARRVTNWRDLEDVAASEWLIRLGGKRVYEAVWEPLLRGKFGDAAPDVAAVWFWNKLKLRGGSRGAAGEERLAYFRGGFSALADLVAARIRHFGGEVFCNSAVDGLLVEQGRIRGVHVRGRGPVAADAVIATPALPAIARLVEPHVAPDYVARLRRIRYLANQCLVLELDRSLSETYWLNVNDPGFPFVGVIEHTNFEPPEHYAGRHIVYLSRYLPGADESLHWTKEELLAFTLPHLQRMFPAFDRRWLLDWHVWQARYAQPIVEKGYSRLIPGSESPIHGLFLASMAQIYPEDRGTNYAVREGRAVAALALRRLMPARRAGQRILMPRPRSTAGTCTGSRCHRQSFVRCSVVGYRQAN